MASAEIIIKGKDETSAATKSARENIKRLREEKAKLNQEAKRTQVEFKSAGVIINQTGNIASLVGAGSLAVMTSALAEAASVVGNLNKGVAISTAALVGIGAAAAAAGTAIGYYIGGKQVEANEKAADSTIKLLEITNSTMKARLAAQQPVLAKQLEINQAIDAQIESVTNLKNISPYQMAGALIELEKTRTVELFELKKKGMMELLDLQISQNEKYKQAMDSIRDYEDRMRSEKFEKEMAVLDQKIEAIQRYNESETEGAIGSSMIERDMQIERVEGLSRAKEMIEVDHDTRLRQIGSLQLSEEESIRLSNLAAGEAAERRKRLNRDVVASTISGASSMFGNLQAAAQAFGAKGAKAAKGFAIVKATMDTYTAATGAYSAMASIPYVGPALGIAAAAAAMAAGMANVAAISSQKAHGGVDFVPETQTVLLEKGERVIKRDQNETLMDMIGGGSGGGGATMVTVLLDGYELFKAMGQASRDGRLTLSSRAIA